MGSSDGGEWAEFGWRVGQKAGEERRLTLNHPRL